MERGDSLADLGSGVILGAADVGRDHFGAFPDEHLVDALAIPDPAPVMTATLLSSDSSSILLFFLDRTRSLFRPFASFPSSAGSRPAAPLRRCKTYRQPKGPAYSAPKPRRFPGAIHSFVDLGYVLPSINVSAVAMNDDRGILRLRQVSAPHLCRVVTVELGGFDLCAIGLGESVLPESAEGRFRLCHPPTIPLASRQQARPGCPWAMLAGFWLIYDTGPAERVIDAHLNVIDENNFIDDERPWWEEFQRGGDNQTPRRGAALAGCAAPRRPGRRRCA